jgi:hypothetical protein
MAVSFMRMDSELVKSWRNGPISQLLDDRGLVMITGLILALFWGVLAAMFGGLSSKIVETKTIPNQGILLSLKNALLTGPGFGLIAALLSGLLLGIVSGFQKGMDTGILSGLTIGTVAHLHPPAVVRTFRGDERGEKTG